MGESGDEGWSQFSSEMSFASGEERKKKKKEKKLQKSREIKRLLADEGTRARGC